MHPAEAPGAASQISRQAVACHKFSCDLYLILGIGAHLEAPCIQQLLPQSFLCVRCQGVAGREGDDMVPACMELPAKKRCSVTVIHFLEHVGQKTSHLTQEAPGKGGR